jgi:MarR family transcriptional regulator, organic hydroperoxide resistance regulator
LTIFVVTTNIKIMAKQSSPGGRGPGTAVSQEERAYLALLRTADRLQGAMAEWLKPHGLSPTQYNALRILRGAGPEGLPCSEVGARMINRDPDITRLVDRLEKRGLVARSRSKMDRRVVQASITPAGLELLSGLDGPVSEFVRGLLGHLSPHRVQALIDLLDEAQRDSQPR